MSHSTVLVVGPKAADVGPQPPKPEWLSNLLAPFDEGTEVEPYKDYSDPLPDGWQITVGNGEKFGALMAGGMERKEAWARVWGERNDDPHIPWVFSSVIREGVDPTNLQAVVDAYNVKWVDSYDDESDRHHLDDGGIYRWSTYNPRSRWDWWSLGGRWVGYLLLRPDAQYEGVRGEPSWGSSSDGAGVDIARVGDVDWEAMGMRRRRKAEGWWSDYGTAHETREQFLTRCSSVATLAVLKDDEWYERGRMGWWGVVHDETERDSWNSRFVELVGTLDPDTLVAVVDVHI